jgi:hypothetical protein
MKMNHLLNNSKTLLMMLLLQLLTLLKMEHQFQKLLELVRK